MKHIYHNFYPAMETNKERARERDSRLRVQWRPPTKALSRRGLSSFFPFVVCVRFRRRYISRFLFGSLYRAPNLLSPVTP